MLYVRPGGRTIWVSEPEKGSDRSPATGLTAGRVRRRLRGRVALSSSYPSGELTKDDEGNHDPELYKYDLESPKAKGWHGSPAVGPHRGMLAMSGLGRSLRRRLNGVLFRRDGQPRPRRPRAARHSGQRT